MGLLSGITAIAGLIGARKQQKATQAQADAIREAGMAQANAMEKAAAPWTEAGTWALPRLQQAIQTEYGTKLGKESPILRGEHEQTISDIRRRGQTALEESSGYWGARGVTGRGRGESLRIRDAMTRMEGAEHLRYGGAQETYKEGMTSRYIGGLGSVADMGRTGLSATLAGIQSKYGAQQEAAGLRSEATRGFWGDVGTMAGDIAGQAEARRIRGEERSLYQSIYGKPEAVNPLEAESIYIPGIGLMPKKAVRRRALEAG